MADAKQLVKRLFDEVWGKGQVELIDQLMDPKYQGDMPLLGKLDREGLKVAIGAYRKAFPDLRFQIRELIAEGDKAMVHWIASGTHKSEFMGIPATGKHNDVEGFTLIELRNGRVARDVGQFDVVTFFKGLGIPLPGPMAGRGRGAEEGAPMH
jgi:steroid delta-isomerase-like uncharacterized protein